MKSPFRWFCVLVWPVLAGFPAAGKVLEVGPGKLYASVCQAIQHSVSGDTIEIDAAGLYKGDVCGWTKNRLTIRGVGSTRPQIDADGHSAQGKGIWVIAGNDTIIENIEFSGAAVPDQNGAAIRQEGTNLTVRNCYFHDNEEGILAGDNPKSSILIEFSEFARNGSGDGKTHNIYINHVAKFTLRFSYSHHANVGHLVKTRAAENYVLYNRLSDEADGTASFELDFSNGGLSYVIGNIIEQGPNSQNSSILAYRLEGGDSRNPETQLYVVNNTFVNDRPEGATFLQINHTSKPAVIINNIFYGKGTLTTQKQTALGINLSNKDPRFVDAAHYDYRLRSDSSARGAGAQPPTETSFRLLPSQEYVHPACGANRVNAAKPDIGAIAFGELSNERLGPSRCQTTSASSRH
jgi:hypothetical protein